jgi:hypothetical protein
MRAINATTSHSTVCINGVNASSHSVALDAVALLTAESSSRALSELTGDYRHFGIGRHQTREHIGIEAMSSLLQQNLSQRTARVVGTRPCDRRSPPGRGRSWGRGLLCAFALLEIGNLAATLLILRATRPAHPHHSLPATTQITLALYHRLHPRCPFSPARSDRLGHRRPQLVVATGIVG